MGATLVKKIRLSREQCSTLVFAEIVLQRGLGSKSPNAGDVCLVIGAITLRFRRPCRRHRDAPLLRLVPRHFLCLLSRLRFLCQPLCSLQFATLGVLELALVLRLFQEG